jgi:NitT/TauT family transport system ATP-binding protein
MSDGEEPILRVEGVFHQFLDQNDNPLPVLSDITFSASAGEFLTIIGPSGCGKSTLLRILGGLLQPSEGEVWFAGERLNAPRNDVGFLFQQSNLMPWRAVISNIILPLEIRGVPKEEAMTKAMELVKQVGLEGFEHSYPSQLSGGMKQRVALARVLIQRPKMLLLDEPFASLDAMTRERLNMELLRLWRHYGQTVVMVTHSITEAVLLADRVLILSQRPARILQEISIDLPRPRGFDVVESQKFIEYERSIRKAVGFLQRP